MALIYGFLATWLLFVRLLDNEKSISIKCLSILSTLVSMVIPFIDMLSSESLRYSQIFMLFQVMS
jgi:hypothetical protein